MKTSIGQMSRIEFAEYAARANADYAERMLASGNRYWPDIDRWYPKDIKIAGSNPETPEATRARLSKNRGET
jgi:hypothetical protein